MSDDAPIERPMPLAAFAATLRPQITSVRTISPRKGPPVSVNVMSKGSPHEIWLRWLHINHKAEKHTKAGWQKLIGDYAGQAAHPADPDYKQGA